MSDTQPVALRCRSAGDILPAELTQLILETFDDQELRRIVREIEDLADHAIEVIKVKFIANNSLTIPDAASVDAYHNDMLGPNHISTNGICFPLEVPIIRGSDPIAGVIRGNEVRVMKILIEAGLDVLSYSKNGWTLLGLALVWGTSDDVAALLIDEMDPAHLLGFARLGDSAPCLLTLAAYSSKEMFRRMWLRVRRLDNWTAYMYPVTHYQLCRHADAAFAEELLADGIDLSRAVLPEQGRTAWHAAAEANNNMDFFEWLYLRIPEQINQGSSLEGYTPLMTAAAERWHDRAKAIKWLLAHGADPEIVSQNGKTAMSMAEAANNPHLIPLLKQESA
ncbi:ankyrin repeat protein [Aspergillus clavatus NRRL 1]|uniref:Ankyrin repeat protein n=1 Tax=Aspergillus clavatus (strain ATCC 1007 / CBS 513.65 / DSM 816 / NCTC 3887 / NRRL 1 / QM 1276 / 107) TaxID=344612 RepID=A1C5I3_ASPCL|nr:ankyrin repeat protein [Aspergillus clavatus NRRL 1]EAW14951.1 ankyrin repeat protein [Aspergillus clavatus NRRL 1]